MARAHSNPYRPLGALRLGLAVLVCVQHYQYLLPAAQRGPFARMGLGAAAVAVFFVISGFVVAEAVATYYQGRPAAFLINRLLRLAPPYYAALGVCVLVHAALWQAGLLRLWDYALTRPPWDPALLAAGLAGLLPGLRTAGVTAGFEFIPFAWSLRVEMAFYLAVAAVGAAASRLSLRRAAQAYRAAWLLGLLLAAGFLTAQRPGLLSNLPMFLAGVALWAWFAGLRHAGPALVVSLPLCVAGITSWQQRGSPDPWLQMPLILALFCACAALAGVAAPARLARLDRRLGALSYPLYLNHYALGIAVVSLTRARGPALLLGCLAAALLLAAVMTRLVDAPLTAWRNRIRRTRL